VGARTPRSLEDIKRILLSFLERSDRLAVMRIASMSSRNLINDDPLRDAA
jgi:hypothetical protein